MSILAMFGEMGSLIPSDSTVVESTSVGLWDTAFTRCATKSNGDTAYADTVTLASSLTDGWVHFDWVSGGTATTDATKRRIVELLDSGGVAYVRVSADGSTTGVYNFSLDRWNGSAWISIGSFSMSGIVRQTFDLHIKSNTASGTADLYIAGTKRIDGGTVDLSGFSGIKRLRSWGRRVSVASASYISQGIIADTSTVGRKLGTIVMTGQGATHTFDTGGFANIDETVYSDADFINSGTNGQIELFTGTPVPSFTGYVIEAVGVYARAKKESSGPAQIQIALKSGATTYFSSTIALDFGYGAIGNIWNTDPATSAAFLSTAIPNLQYGVKSIT